MQHTTQIEQRGHPYSTSHQQVFLIIVRRQRKTISQRQDNIYCLPFFQHAETLRTVSDASHKKMQLVAFRINIIY